MNRSGRSEQRGYWSGVAGAKRFTHPLEESWLVDLAADARIVDLGCGYGRLFSALGRRGLRRVIGVDSATGMARLAASESRVVVASALALPHAAAVFDAALAFSLLTCLPRDGDQRRVVAEAQRVLKPGGLLYLSDLLLQDDERNRARYRRDSGRFGPYGTFRLPEGVVVRHLSRPWLAELLAGLERVAFRELDVLTMNGHAARGFQLLARRP